MTSGRSGHVGPGASPGSPAPSEAAGRAYRRAWWSLALYPVTFAAAFVIVFMTSWNSYLWPLIVLQSNETKTITLVVSSLLAAKLSNISRAAASPRSCQALHAANRTFSTSSAEAAFSARTAASSAT